MRRSLVQFWVSALFEYHFFVPFLFPLPSLLLVFFCSPFLRARLCCDGRRLARWERVEYQICDVRCVLVSEGLDPHAYVDRRTGQMGR
ncbi:hypothetical protein PVAG01_09872 [Phlyctema vagabunda]|uniref:Secreted protein n=1 Tax=Phlyctema vagabunda TaxID=108571 RepID=A0ABR4P4A7_9HELO